MPYVADGSAVHTLDLFTPRDRGPGPFPVLIWVHGGGWRMGDKADLDSGDLQTSQMKALLLSNGYAVASVNYRLLPDTRFPEPMQDVAAAVRYLRGNAASLGLDPARFAIGGESAGAHLAAMVGMTTSKNADLQGTLGTTGVDASVRAVVGYYGIYDLRARTKDQQSLGCSSERTGAESSHGRLIGANPDSPEGAPVAAKASPISYVRADSPPMLLFHGRQDCTAPYPQAVAMNAALAKARVATHLTLIDAGHAQSQFYTDPALKRQLLRFMDAHVKAARG